MFRVSLGSGAVLTRRSASVFTHLFICLDHALGDTGEVAGGSNVLVVCCCREANSNGTFL